MESFNFENNFEIEANYPQAEVFTKFEEYVSKKTWKIVYSNHNESISFQTRTALIAITFIANNDNSTILSIITKTEKFDNNRSKGVVRKILKECFSEQIDNVEEEHKEVQSSNSKPKQKKKRSNSKPKYSKKQTVYNTNDNTSNYSSYVNWRNIAIAVFAIVFIVTKFSPTSESNSDTTSTSISNSLCGTYIEYPNVDRRITRTYVLNSDGSATVTFKHVTDFSNRTETDTHTDYGWWDKGDGYIRVVYDDAKYRAYLILGEKKVYHTLNSYHSRRGGCEFEKKN